MRGLEMRVFLDKGSRWVQVSSHLNDAMHPRVGEYIQVPIDDRLEDLRVTRISWEPNDKKVDIFCRHRRWWQW